MLGFAAELSARLLADSLAGYRDALVSVPLREGLRAYLSGGVEWSRERPGLLRFLARAAYHGDPAFGESLVRPLARTMRELVRAMVEAAGARGELRAGLDTDAAVRMIHALSIPLGDTQLLPHLNAYFLLFDEAHPPARVSEALIDILAYALTGATEKGARHGQRSPRRRGARQEVR
jgi:AcrR family transcriptional regulator